MPARPACGIQRRPSKESRRRLLKLLPAPGIFLPDCLRRAVAIRVAVDLCEAFHCLDGKTKLLRQRSRGILCARLRTADDAANAFAGQPLCNLSRLTFACSVQWRVVRLRQMSFVGHSMPDQNKLRHDYSAPTGGLRLQVIEVYDKRVY
jgi:hypothetical protein